MITAPGKYLYGLGPSGVCSALGEIGIEYGGRPARVYELDVAGICAVMSDFPSRERVRPLRKNLQAHNRVIREFLKAGIIIPMVFGQVARNAREVITSIERNRKGIEREIARLHEAVEMTLRVFWDVDNIFEYFVSENRELAAYRDEIFSRSRAPSQTEKIELGRLFEQCLSEARDVHTARVMELFRGVTDEVRAGALEGEKMVMNLAFLVNRARMELFEHTVHEVARGFPAHYTFDFSGPWAPSSFVELDFRLGAQRAGVA